MHGLYSLDDHMSRTLCVANCHISPSHMLRLSCRVPSGAVLLRRRKRRRSKDIAGKQVATSSSSDDGSPQAGPGHAR